MKRPNDSRIGVRMSMTPCHLSSCWACSRPLSLEAKDRQSSGLPVIGPQRGEYARILSMRLHIDSIRAGLIAVGLWGVVAVACFGIPHGFEEQIGWFKLLLPSVLISGPVYERLPHSHPHIASFVYWTSAILVSLICYYGMSLVGVKICRLVNRA
jgi:hypothetical protein